VALNCIKKCPAKNSSSPVSMQPQIMTTYNSCTVSERNWVRIKTVNSAFWRRHNVPLSRPYRCQNFDHSWPQNWTHRQGWGQFDCRQNLTRNRRLATEPFRPKVLPTDSIKTNPSTKFWGKLGIIKYRRFTIFDSSSWGGLGIYYRVRIQFGQALSGINL